MLARALEKRNVRKEQYWEKKEQSKKLDNFRKLKSDVIVREFMGLYNLLTARTAKEEGIPFIYRVQDEEYISK